MSLPKTLYGSSRSIPQSGERKWGNTMTQVVADLIDGVDGISLLLASGVALLKLESTTTSLAAAATLTPTHPIHRIQSTGGVVILSGTTAIADGSVNGQILALHGVSDANAVTIPDGANTLFNGDIFLGNKHSCVLEWDSTNSAWRDVSRNN